MKNILCFGDSITWGFDPETFGRFPTEERWTMRLQHELTGDVRIIEEGLGGRTTVLDTPYQDSRSGVACLPMLLESHMPLDLVILMLGTNDLKPQFSGDARAAAAGCGSCIEKILASSAGIEGLSPKVLLMAPPPMKKPVKGMEVYFGEGIDESQHLAENYKKIAGIYQVPFFDAGAVVEVSALDGIHLDKAAQPVLARHLAEFIQPILDGSTK